MVEGRRSPWKSWVIVSIILSISVAIAYSYFFRVDFPYRYERIELHRRILERTAESPYRYRVLVPYTADLSVRALAAFLPYRIAFMITYAIFDLASIFSFLLILYYFCRLWFSREASMIGVLFVGATVSIALRDHYFQPWSILEAVIFSLALIVIYRNRRGLLYPLIVLASLNRETALFIPLAFVAANSTPGAVTGKDGGLNGKDLIFAAGLLSVWLALFLAVRSSTGNTTHIYSLGELWAKNTSARSILKAVVNNAAFLGAFWIFAFNGFRKAPLFVRRVGLLLPVYLILILVFGVWYEVRLWMPFYPVFIAAALSFLFGEEIAGKSEA